jgi:hypothetical protein
MHGNGRLRNPFYAPNTRTDQHSGGSLLIITFDVAGVIEPWRAALCQSMNIDLALLLGLHPRLRDEAVLTHHLWEQRMQSCKRYPDIKTVDFLAPLAPSKSVSRVGFAAPERVSIPNPVTTTRLIGSERISCAPHSQKNDERRD